MNRNLKNRQDPPLKQWKPKIYRSLATGFASKMAVNLVYEDLITLAPGTVYGSYLFRGNSLFDPDYTGTGHQPRYFDQLTPIYGRYKVLKSDCEVEMINGSPTSGAIFAVTPNTEIITFTSWEQASELPRAKCSDIMPVASRYPFKLKHSISTTSVCGLLPYQVNDEDWSAAIGNNPLQIWYWNINAETIDRTSNLLVSFRVKLVYHAIMYDRLDVGTS